MLFRSPKQAGWPGSARSGSQATLPGGHVAGRYGQQASHHVEQPVPPVQEVSPAINWPQAAEQLKWRDAFERASAMTMSSASPDNSRDLSALSPTHANLRATSADGIGRLIDVLA